MKLAKHPKTFQVLLVDDQIQDLIQPNYLAAHLGIVPTLAFDGQEAIEQIQKNSYDLVVLDWNMPTPGWYVLQSLEHIYRTQKRERIKVVLFTSEDLSLDVFDHYQSFQVMQIWRKPVAVLDMLKKLNFLKIEIGEAK